MPSTQTVVRTRRRKRPAWRAGASAGERSEACRGSVAGGDLTILILNDGLPADDRRFASPRGRRSGAIHLRPCSSGRCLTALCGSSLEGQSGGAAAARRGVQRYCTTTRSITDGHPTLARTRALRARRRLIKRNTRSAAHDRLTTLARAKGAGAGSAARPSQRLPAVAFRGHQLLRALPSRRQGCADCRPPPARVSPSFGRFAPCQPG
jgi:hypothetical protein